MNDISDSEIQPENPETGFSFEEGVKHCGSKEALMKTIRIFYRTIDSKANKIEQCLKEGLISDYVIEVHALKSSALLIGAVPLSEAAKELEDYGKQGKTEVLEEKHRMCLPCTMLKIYCAPMQRIRSWNNLKNIRFRNASGNPWISCVFMWRMYRWKRLWN